ncbi:unnamed protein product [Pipistrellus nathusii]|uniref:Uncharacterized protein n=1 Tax=Pipistrellus nathusii TaxID=59473 RepID=A0ABP0A3V1_PIPNA
MHLDRRLLVPLEEESDGGLAVTSAGQPMELSSHSQARGHIWRPSLVTLCVGLASHGGGKKKIKKNKQEQGGPRGKEYNNVLQIVFWGFCFNSECPSIYFSAFATQRSSSLS